MRFSQRRGSPQSKTFLRNSPMEVRSQVKFVVLFEKLFNILYDEQVNCKLVKSPLLDVRIQNWNKINA